jgi:hypothetical protein
MPRNRVPRPIPAHWSHLAFAAAALVVVASGFALGASMALGIQ